MDSKTKIKKCPKYVINAIDKSHRYLLTDISRTINGVENNFGYVSLDEYATAFCYVSSFKAYVESMELKDLKAFLEYHDNLEQTIGLILNIPQKAIDWIEEHKESLGLGE